MNQSDLKYFHYAQLPGGHLSPEQINELLHLRFAGRTWTTHEPWSDNAVVIAGRIAQLAQDVVLSADRPGMVLTGGLEESEALTGRLRDFLPEVPIRNLTIDDRLSPGRSRTCRAAVTKEAVVQVITYRMFREAQQSFWKTSRPVVFLDDGDRLVEGGRDYEFTKRLAHAAASLHLFTTTGAFDNPVTTFRLAALLHLADIPRTLQAFKTAYVRSTGYGMHEVMAWREPAVTELTAALDLHHHCREDGSSTG